MAENPHAFEELRALLAARQKLYARADHTVDTSERTIEASRRRSLADTRRLGRRRKLRLAGEIAAAIAIACWRLFGMPMRWNFATNGRCGS